MPEWYKHVTAGGKATYGKRTNLSMKEQRESLPIFQLKKALLQVSEEGNGGGGELERTDGTITSS